MWLTTLFLTLLTISLVLIPLTLLRLRTILDPGRPKPAEIWRREGKTSKDGNAGRDVLDTGKEVQDGRRTAHLMIVLGSGGHTGEMIGMLERACGVQEGDERTEGLLDLEKFPYRTYVVNAGDDISASRARKFEEAVAGRSKRKKGDCGGDERSILNETSDSTTPQQHQRQQQQHYRILTVPRARKIHQPLYTTPFTSLQCLHASIRILLPSNPHWPIPDLLLLNGPSTASILVLASLILRFFNLAEAASRGKLRIVYVESWARVKGLSLSGRLVEGVVDRFVVQWEGLAAEGREYLGVLV